MIIILYAIITNICRKVKIIFKSCLSDNDVKKVS